jgi:large subunit ribosomal protein L21
MIAVVEIGGKQYTVEKGQSITVDRQDLEVGKSLEVAPLLISDKEGKDVKIGTPTVEGAKVKLKVIEHTRGDKVTVFKIISKKRHTRTHGFRASETVLEVASIV